MPGRVGWRCSVSDYEKAAAFFPAFFALYIALSALFINEFISLPFSG